MKKPYRYLAGLILGLAVSLTGFPAQAGEFTATEIIKSDGQEMHGKIFLKGQKIRQELGDEGEFQVSIVRPDRKIVWILMPEEKRYLEMPFTAEAQKKFMLEKPDENQARMKHLGTETVNGFECDKYEISPEQEGQPAKEYVWVAKKLGVPIKYVSPEGSMEYRDIKLEEVPDSAFEVPQGFKKMEMPRMPHLK